ncbi:SAM-dependent methyltransferase [Gordonia humi]|uniref:Release factor glutamine methyltransferase n=1 Tax=Gordonia humi TaxID=686429 RepID=A0A840F2T1_9ACTN|nr:release factor glutamine methyltransferase [Gordonia humi]
MFADDEARVLRRWASDAAQLAAWVRRRTGGEPLEHIVGRVEFAGLDLRVGPGEFVPRQRSLLLADVATDLVAGRRGVFVEACCGVAPIGAVIADRRPEVWIVLTDSDAAVLEHARRNVVGAAVCRGELLDAVPIRMRRSVAVIAAVAPYVPDDQAGLLPAEAVEHERPHALFGGWDGLDVIRRLLVEAVDVVAPNGAVALEMHRSQADAAARIAEGVGFSPSVVLGDDGQTAVLVAATSA